MAKSVAATIAVISELRYVRNRSCKLTYVFVDYSNPHNVQHRVVTVPATARQVPLEPGMCIAKIEYDSLNPEGAVEILNALWCDVNTVKTALELLSPHLSP